VWTADTTSRSHPPSTTGAVMLARIIYLLIAVALIVFLVRLITGAA
jgi:hypothetical protein